MKPAASPDTEMTEKSLHDFFRGNCPPELEDDVRKYLKTPAGQKFAAGLMDEDIAGVLGGDEQRLPAQPVPVGLRDRILQEIGRRNRRRERLRSWSRVAAVALPFVFLNILLLGELRDRNTGDLSYRRLEVPAGEQMRVLMADGTAVTLNSESVLEYPVSFARRNREVRLQGEAFFDIAKDPKRPFHVRTEELTVRVLGTKFNLNTLSPEQTTVYLQEGHVDVREHVSGQNRSYDLQPGQFLRVDKESGGAQLQKNADSAAVMGWMHKRYYFKNTPLRDLLAFLERSYGVQCRVTDGRLYKYTYTINFYNESVDQILSAMERITPVHIVRVNDSVTVEPLR